ncbi:MAG: response regulator [Planctomycetia bacterium]|nr:response regulator [Planctomycetia bacterium]
MSKTILIVEDNAATRDGLSALLRAHHYETVLAANVDEALSSCRNGLSPALILLDMILPGSDGWKFIEQRKRDRQLASIPFVIVTGLGIASEAWALDLGAAALVRKPINIDTLLERVRQLAADSPGTPGS